MFKFAFWEEYFLPVQTKMKGKALIQGLKTMAVDMTDNMIIHLKTPLITLISFPHNINNVSKDCSVKDFRLMWNVETKLSSQDVHSLPPAFPI